MEKMELLNKYEYYRTDMGVLYCGDSYEIMKLLQDNSFDLALTDPPYGIGNIYKMTHSRDRKARAMCKNDKMEWNHKPIDEKFFSEVFRISKNQIIWGANYYNNLLKPGKKWIVWDKVNYNSSFSNIELAWTSFEGADKLIRYMWSGMQQGKSIEEGHIMQGNKALNEKRYHPTQKPLCLAIKLLQDFSRRGQIVVDPFFGSGWTGKACEKLNIRWAGIEISEEYCEKAKNSIQADINQLKLFK